MIKTISSNNNPIIKDFIKLKTKKGIQNCNSCFVESEKVVLELIKQKQKIKKLFIVESKKELFKNIINLTNTFIISNQVANKLSETVSTSGVFAEFELPKQKEINFNKKFLVLDEIQDPSNLGAIIRSALAFGYNQIITLGGVYPYLSKVIRSSMGYVFKINFKSLTINDLLELKKINKFKLISANLFGKNINEFKIANNFGLVIGNEGNGVSKECQNLCDYTVTIPMNTEVESLNASVSAGILMYLLK